MAAVTTIGLVLGAGGLHAAAHHAGTLAALAEATGWDPRTADVVVGTSAGATTAVSLRAGWSEGFLRSNGVVTRSTSACPSADSGVRE